MSIRPTTHLPLVPFLYYENPAAAIQWLCNAFGFTQRFRLTMPNGAIAHAEVEIGGGVVIIGNVGTRNHERPSTVRSSVYVFVENVDLHCEAARHAGAEIVESPKDQPFGDRTYLAKDNEGHEWYFAQHVRDVSVEELSRLLRR
jgi:uncharacterized glyoxalase superfamily protein PhnB